MTDVDVQQEIDELKVQLRQVNAELIETRDSRATAVKAAAESQKTAAAAALASAAAVSPFVAGTACETG